MRVTTTYTNSTRGISSSLKWLRQTPFSFEFQLPRDHLRAWPEAHGSDIAFRPHSRGLTALGGRCPRQTRKHRQGYLLSKLHRAKSGDVVEADCWLAGQFFGRDRVVGHCLTAWRLALRTTEKETAMGMKGLNLVLPSLEFRSCVNVEVAVLASQSLKVRMVSVEVKRHWTWTWPSSEPRSCVKVRGSHPGLPGHQ